MVSHILRHSWIRSSQGYTISSFTCFCKTQALDLSSLKAEEPRRAKIDGRKQMDTPITSTTTSYRVTTWFQNVSPLHVSFLKGMQFTSCGVQWSLFRKLAQGNIWKAPQIVGGWKLKNTAVSCQYFDYFAWFEVSCLLLSFFFSENISSLRVMKGMLPWSGHNSNLWFFIIPGCLPRDGHQEDDDGPPEELTTETAAAVEEVDELLGEVWQMP